MAGQYPRHSVPGLLVGGVAAGFTQNGKPKYDVQCNNGESYSCFDPGKASKAQQAVGAGPVDVIISVNGNYKNFEDVVPAGQGAAIAPPLAAGFGAPVANPFAPAAPTQFVGGPAPAFTPAPGFQDNKAIEARRGYAVAGAATLLSPLVGTGFYVNEEDGSLDIAKLESDLIPLAGVIARYAVEGPSAVTGAAPGVATPEQPVEAQAAALPPGVSPEDLARWVASQTGVPIAVGTPVPAEVATPAAY